MRRFFLSVLIVLACAMVFAGTADVSFNQKIWSVDSEVYEAIVQLCIMSGHAMPSSSGPWSSAELLMMMDRIDTLSLDSSSLKVYEYIMGQLEAPAQLQIDDKLGMSLDAQFALEGYIHTNTDSFIGKESFAYNYQKQKPTINLKWETFATENYYNYFEFSFGNTMNSLRSVGEGDDKHVEEAFGSSAVSTNIVVLEALKLNLNTLNLTFPRRAFISFGGENWNVELGRDRLKWGYGTSGSLIISDSLAYHNMARFTGFFDKFKYSFLLSFFPHPGNYYNTTPDAGWNMYQKYNRADSGISFYMAHRLEGRFFKDKLNFSVLEAIIFMAEDGFVDLRVLNPAGFFHNYYIKSNANSTLAFEADYTIMNGLNVFGQLLVDEFSMPGEKTPKNSPNAFPPSKGFIIGANKTFGLGDGIMYIKAEFAKTDPFLYLRHRTETDGSQQRGQYGINYVVALREYNMQDDTAVFNEYFLGYKYGGDALVANLNTGWRVFGKLRIEANVFYMAHGTFDKWTNWTRIGNGDEMERADHSTYYLPYYGDCQTPTSSHLPTNNRYEDVSSRNAVSHTLDLGLCVSYDIRSSFNVFAQLDFISIRNNGNVSGVDVSDFQIAVGTSYTL